MPTALKTCCRQRIEDGRHHHRHSHIRIVRKIETIESWWSHTNYRDGVFIDQNCLPDNSLILRKSSCPVCVTQHGNGMCTWRDVVILGEQPTQPRTNAEYLKEITGD